MHPVILSQLNKFSESFSISDFSESDKFELYSIHSIINGKLGENIDCNMAHLKGT